MKRFIHFLVVLLAFSGCEKSGKGDPPDKDVHNFDQQILDGYFVTAIAFDKQGNAWIGTFKQGLIKYNANETVVYNSQNSIISDTSVIHTIAVDSKNNIWIGSEGLIKYDGNNFSLFNASNTPIPENYVQSIAIDSEDNVWFSASRFRLGGLVKYDGADWTVFTPDNSDLPVNLIKSVAVDHNDNIWLALSEIVREAYLVKISNNDLTVYDQNTLGFSPFYFGNIRISSDNKVFGSIDYSLSATIVNNGPQVFIFDGVSSQLLQFDNTSKVKSVTLDNLDNIWCPIIGGYAAFDGQSWRTDNSIFREEGVFAIEQAPDDKIWIGTGDGIFIGD